MQSVLVEYLRMDDLDTGLLQARKRYVLAEGDLPVVEVETPRGYAELLEEIQNNLRYDSDISYDDKWSSISKLSTLLAPFFVELNKNSYSGFQLDVVLSPSELGLFPFELLLDEDGNPHFANKDKQLVFTRRIRHKNIAQKTNWPLKPRVLFIYASGGGHIVPANDHIRAFDYALEKWGGTSNKDVFTLLSDGTFEELAELLKSRRKAEDQFTHVHILAHGAELSGNGKFQNFEYGIVFGKDKGKITSVAEIKDLFEGLNYKPFLVSYMVCDGANFLNPTKIDKNPVQVTHKAGVPIVIGSQLPLSMRGSTLITKELYSQLFTGKDIRNILFDIRTKLFARHKEHHDWVSMTAYVRLPEGYDEYLSKATLMMQFQQLKYVKSKTDKYLNEGMADGQYIDCRAEITNCINRLEQLLKEFNETGGQEANVLEDMGLLASAYKRLAELAHLKGGNDQAEIRSLLGRSCQYYRDACRRNLSQHWQTVQYLSLLFVLNLDPIAAGYWCAADIAVRNAIEADSGDGWAYGSMLELCLLSPREGDGMQQKVSEALSKLIQIAREKNNKDMLVSTSDQFNRYQTWWLPANGFHVNLDYWVNDQKLLSEIRTDLNAAIAEM